MNGRSWFWVPAMLLQVSHCGSGGSDIHFVLEAGGALDRSRATSGATYAVGEVTTWSVGDTVVGGRPAGTCGTAWPVAVRRPRSAGVESTPTARSPSTWHRRSTGSAHSRRGRVPRRYRAARRRAARSRGGITAAACLITGGG
jgi:threonine dehydrogenase-like Zn-dependent dehydrogenase